MTSESVVWLLATKINAQQFTMSRLHEMPMKPKLDASHKTSQTQNVQRHISCASEMGQKASPLPRNSCYVQIDNGTRQSVPTYVLKDISRIVEETGVNLDMRGSCAIKRSLTRIKSTNCERDPTSAQRLKPQTTRRPNEQQSTSHRVSSSVQRNKSMEYDVIRPNTTKGGSEQSPRRALQPSQTSSATVTRCSTPTSRGLVARPPLTYTNHYLQRKIHGGKVPQTAPQLKGLQTYSVKKPLPYKVSCATLRSQSRSVAKNLPQSSQMSPSSESLFTQSDAQWQHNDVGNNNCAIQKSHAFIPDRIVPGIVSDTRSKPHFAALPRTPTQQPSVKQLKDVRTGHFDHSQQQQQQPPRADISDDIMFQHPQQAFVNGQSSKENIQTDELSAGTDRSHPSPSEHSFRTRFNDPDSSTVDYPTRHMQIARKPADSTDGRVEHYRHSTSPISSASQASVASCRQRNKTRVLRQPPATLSMSTLATDAGSCATRPALVAPSRPAGHRQTSKIPRPKSAVGSSVSVTSTISKCSSITSLRSEFNYARPMPIERIPFSKFGFECIVPLARQGVSVTAVEEFSITGVSGKSKRYLPQTESIGEDTWQKVWNTVDALPVVTAHYDASDDACNVSIISSLVARPVSHAATQTRKSVSLTSSKSRQRNKTGMSRKEKAEKQEETTEDYSGMLVKLVQLLYLQTKLNASKADKNNSAAGRPASDPSQMIADYLQKHEHHNHAPTRTAQANTAHSSGHVARVYRMGSSVTQVYSKNNPSMPVGHAQVESADNWANAIKSRTVYFDHAQSDTKPWSNYGSLTPAAFKPNYNQRHHNYDNRHPKMSSYTSASHMRYTHRPTF